LLILVPESPDVLMHGSVLIFFFTFVAGKSTFAGRRWTLNVVPNEFRMNGLHEA
jgi:hypothetical protein